MPVAASMRGFPEWLPMGQLVEQHVLATLRQVFELHGYGPLDTRSVETLDTLLKKGETDKEIYVLRRLHAEADGSDSGLGLHFDLTVPFARYVAENSGKLTFPYRRYQIQKAWRGERPQEGRYREFLQADIDVVDRGKLASHFECELPIVAADALGRLPIPPVTIQVSNRKMMEGFFVEIGLGDDTTAVFRAIDKLRKIGPQGVRELLEAAGATSSQATMCLRLAEIRSPDLSFADEVRSLGVTGPLVEEGLGELCAVLEAGHELAPGLLVADLQITRGLDYYTGTVYETVMKGYESLGSICSGGRYDNLVADAREKFPGVGLSIGVSRILGPLLGRGSLSASRSVPTCVLVAVSDDAGRGEANRVAAALRARGIPTEVSPSAAKYGKQIRYADQRGIPYVWFPGRSGDLGEVRDIRTGTQLEADAFSWDPPPEDLYVGVSAVAGGQAGTQTA
ncbi:MAG: histidine--tRNA ligase [Acidimicrobiales bacterium]